MVKSFGLLFFLRKPKGWEGGEIPVYMKITVDGDSVEISTKRKCDPTKWNSSSGRMNGKTEVVREFNSYLDLCQHKVYEAKRHLMEIGRVVSATNIKAQLQGKDNSNRKMILEVFQEHNDRLKELVGLQFAPATIKRYKTSIGHTKKFIKWKYKVSDLPISELNYEMINDYEFWFKSVRKCDHNTTMKYLANFRKIVNHCMKMGWLQKDPFYGFKMGKKEVYREALTEPELQAIASKRFTIDRLNIVRDIFLFSCYTGLAYIDVKQLKKTDLHEGNDGELWIVSSRQKTATLR